MFKNVEKDTRTSSRRARAKGSIDALGRFVLPNFEWEVPLVAWRDSSSAICST